MNEDTKKKNLEKIVAQKPIVDGLIEKVAKLKVKPTSTEKQLEIQSQQRQYKKKLNAKPKKRISLEF